MRSGLFTDGVEAAHSLGRGRCSMRWHEPIGWIPIAGRIAAELDKRGRVRGSKGDTGKDL